LGFSLPALNGRRQRVSVLQRYLARADASSKGGDVVPSRYSRRSDYVRSFSDSTDQGKIVRESELFIDYLEKGIGAKMERHGQG